MKFDAASMTTRTEVEPVTSVESRCAERVCVVVSTLLSGLFCGFASPCTDVAQCVYSVGDTAGMKAAWKCYLPFAHIVWSRRFPNFLTGRDCGVGSQCPLVMCFDNSLEVTRCGECELVCHVAVSTGSGMRSQSNGFFPHGRNDACKCRRAK